MNTTFGMSVYSKEYIFLILSKFQFDEEEIDLNIRFVYICCHSGSFSSPVEIE
jgi:hypothetical protein